MYFIKIILFKYLLNNYKNYIYLTSTRIKINLWSFIHIHILYFYQRTSIMVWLNNIHGLSSKFIKTIRISFDYYALYKSVFVYTIVLIVVLSI